MTAIAAGYIALIGIVILGLATLIGIGMNFTMDNNHLQNPDMPYNEYPKNASYVWTHSEIMDIMYTLLPIALGGLIAGAGGFFVLFILPDKKDFHKVGCENGKLISLAYPSLKYCPECGIKLSELEPKKRNN